MAGRSCLITAAACLSLSVAACGGGASSTRARSTHTGSDTTATRRAAPTTTSSATSSATRPGTTPLPPPRALVRFTGATAGPARWRTAGRRVHGVAAVYETMLVPPGGSQPAGLAWMDTRLLAARLYSGSRSPGGGPYRYTAPVRSGVARHLVAAFNGGFMMGAAAGGYYTERRVVDRLRSGAASLVIYAGGSVNVGAWHTDVRMTPTVVAVRQNLVPLVAGGRPTPRARSADWQAWGSTCGRDSCAASVPGIEHQWRTALGVTSDGALVYVQGPALDPLQLASLLVRAGVMRGMELDINPDWPVFATYDPAGAHGLATPSNGHLLTATVRGPDTFFDASWARDFVTMSAR
ncbi:MAG: hypothetical protein WBQ18_04145 [Solirubrobacteraceae bacterium]